MTKQNRAFSFTRGIWSLPFAALIAAQCAHAAGNPATAASTQSTASTDQSINDDDPAPKDRPLLHDPNDDHAPMPKGLSVAAEAGDASDMLSNATAVSQDATVQTSTSSASSSQKLDTSHISFYADTDHPKNGTYTLGEQVNLCMMVRGLLANDTLHIVIKNADGVEVSNQYVPVVPHWGGWRQCVAAPSTKLGFYRAGIHLMRTNVTLAALRSRPGGYLTYAIMPDPTERTQHPASESFFGLQMPDTITYLAPNLGVRWTLANWSYGWRYGEHQYPGQFLAHRASDPDFPGSNDKVTWKGGTWQLYEIPTFFMYPIPDASANDWQTSPLPVILDTASFMTAALTEGNPAGVTWWASFVQQAAQAFVDFHPSSNYDQRVYQITWEPRYKGTYDQITRIYQIAYPLIHAIDGNAIVAGPSASAMNNAQRMFELTRFFKANLLQYADGLAMHTYTVWPPETAQGHSQSDPNPQTPPGPYYTLAQSIQIAKEKIEQSIGHDLPMYSTEFGGNTKCDNSKLPCVSKELSQAQGLIRENLILLGEGFKVAVAFYGSDYVTDSEQGYYGLYYNLDPSSGWYHPTKVGPKPSAAAYSAMTFLLEGHHGVKAVTGLGSTVRGYSYTNSSSTVVAVWDYYGARQVSLQTGASEVTVYDWMGNGQTVKTHDGLVDLSLSKDPVYVRGVAASMWGDSTSTSSSSSSSSSTSTTSSAGQAAASTTASTAATNTGISRAAAVTP